VSRAATASTTTQTEPSSPLHQSRSFNDAVSPFVAKRSSRSEPSGDRIGPVHPLRLPKSSKHRLLLRRQSGGRGDGSSPDGSRLIRQSTHGGEAAALVLAIQEFVANGGRRPPDRRRHSAASRGRRAIVAVPPGVAGGVPLRKSREVRNARPQTSVCCGCGRAGAFRPQLLLVPSRRQLEVAGGLKGKALTKQEGHTGTLGKRADAWAPTSSVDRTPRKQRRLHAG